MTIKERVGVRPLESSDDLAETRLEAIGFVFHGPVPIEGRRPSTKAGTNLLHFARCAKLDKVADGEAVTWFRTIGIAKTHLDETVGPERWKWCKVCVRDVTQRILNES